MTQLTDYAENRLADFIRGYVLPLPASWHVALGSAADDASFTELSGAGYARVAVPRGLPDWAGTQGPGTTLMSNGASHATSNNAPIVFATVGDGGWGSAAAVGLFDAAAGGNCWMWAERPALAFNAGDDYSIPAGALAFTLGLVGGMSTYLANRLIDRLFRGQVFSWPQEIWSALYTAAPSNAGGGLEVTAPSYARAALVASLDAISGTQGAGTNAPSSGTSGRVSNNVAVEHPLPAQSWGTLTHAGWMSAPSGGELLFWGALPGAKTIGAGSAAPRYDIARASFTFG